MAYGKLQSGHWIVAGWCSEPRFNYVGEAKTPKTIWINVVAWRDMAYILYQARKGDSVMATGLLHEHEWEGRVYKDIQAEFVSVARKEDPYAGAAPPAAPAASTGAQDWTELSEDDDGELPF